MRTSLHCCVISLGNCSNLCLGLFDKPNADIGIQCLGIYAVQDKLSAVPIFPGLLVCNLCFDLWYLFSQVHKQWLVSWFRKLYKYKQEI